jgi:Collagen triple helix repeat (20 copies)
MKKFLFFVFSFSLYHMGYSQVPNQFNYQAVARNTQGQNIPNANIKVRFTLLDGSATGTSVYAEERQLTTNQLGLFTAAIGGPGANNITGNFSTINWSTGKKFIKVEVDPLGGNNFITIGNTEMLSVPYALYAVNGKPGVPGPSNILNIGTVSSAPNGTTASATITGTSPAQTLNLTLPAGPQGIQGIQGATGAKGDIGLAGPIGATGLQGPKGDIGLTGPTGNTGPQGSQGIAGPIGPSGGPSGPQGPAGLPGPAGPAGNAGTVGADGKTTLIKTTPEAVSANCANGGIKHEYGVDVNNNGTLEASEINTTLTKYICNGAPGSGGGGGGTDGWKITGNAANNAGNFLGTTDNQSVIIKTKNIDRINIGSNDTIAIGNGGGINLSVNGKTDIKGSNLKQLFFSTDIIGGTLTVSHFTPGVFPSFQGNINTLKFDGETIQAQQEGTLTAAKTANLILNPFGGSVNIGEVVGAQGNRTTLVVNSKPSLVTNAIFGNNGNGISFQKNFPTIGFNAYRDINNVQRYMGTGYGFNMAVSPVDGLLFFNAMGTGAANAAVGANENYRVGISQEGNMGIGTLPNAAYRLSINGNVRSKEVVVETGWADFVFDKKYFLLPLPEVEKYIKANNHLPEIPSAIEIQTNGLKVGELQTKMMQKIEELTLYVIQLNKEIELLKAKK